MKNKQDCQETNVITNVTESKNWYNISMDGLGCGLKMKYGVKPKVGDKLTIHTKGTTFGNIRGMDLNGKNIFWKTDEELENYRKEWLRKNEEEKQRKFYDNVGKMDKQYEALPKCFQKRIDRFRINNKRFRIDYEGYELFCCEQAVLIANACKTKEKVQTFKEMSWDTQITLVKGLSHDHSGNTFGTACALAYWYLERPENVVKLHGALSPLVGSKEYGDVEKTDKI